MADYRVREARVFVPNGYRDVRRRMFLAERRVSILSLFSFWWPCDNGGWRRSSGEAERDAERDAELRAPLSSPRLFEIK